MESQPLKSSNHNHNCLSIFKLLSIWLSSPKCFWKTNWSRNDCLQIWIFSWNWNLSGKPCNEPQDYKQQDTRSFSQNSMHMYWELVFFCPRWVVAHTWPFRKVTWRNTIPTLILLLQTLYIFIYSFISNIYAGWPSSALSWFDQVACLPLEWLMFNFSWQYPLKTCIHKPVEFVFWIVLLPVETKNKNYSVPVCLC